MKILITGASGFIGKSLIKKFLKKEVRVLALSRKKNRNIKNIEWIVSDLNLKEKTFQKILKFKPEIVFHLAWEKIPDFSKKTCKLNYDKNLSFFKKIFKIKSIKKIIVSGSCFEYLNKKGRKKESNKVDDKNNFPRTKNLIFNFLKTKCKNNQKIAWFRIFYAYGPGQRKNSLIPYLINSSKKRGGVIEVKNPYVKNDYIYIDDIARVLVKSLYVNFRSGIYNLGTGLKIKTLKIIKIIEKINKKKFKIKSNNYSNKNTNSFYADMNKTKKTFKIRNFTNIDEGLKKILL